MAVLSLPSAHYLRCLLCAWTLASRSWASSSVKNGSSRAPGLGGPHAWLVPAEEFPLRTEGRYIVGKGGTRVKWSCVNWYGAYSETTVPGGLEERSLEEIVTRIVELGFNCVRLCYSTQAQLENKVVQKEYVLKNPQLWGLQFQDVWDATVVALTRKSLMVIINNQIHRNGWCCHWSQDEGLWYVPEYPESVWIDSLVNMTLRYQNNPYVVGIDLRNEVHDYNHVTLTWGDGNPKTDWAAAATRAGNSVLQVNPNMIIVVMALCFGMDLRAAKEHPIQLSVPNRVVYEAHNYLEYQLWSLISQGFISWRKIRIITGICVALMTLILIVLIREWIRLGKPRPPMPALVLTLSSWIFVLALIGIGITEACLALLAQAPACGYWARNDVIPARTCLIVIAVVPASLAILDILFCCWLEKLSHCCGWRGRGKGPVQTSKPNERGSTNNMVGDPVQIALSSSVEEAPDVAPSIATAPSLSLRGSAPQSPQSDLQQVCPEDGSSSSNSMTESEETEKESECRLNAERMLGVQSCGSCALFRRHIMEDWMRPSGCSSNIEISLENSVSAEDRTLTWDCGLCCGLQCTILLIMLTAVFSIVFIFGFMAPTYWLFQTHMNNQWGFVLEEGHPYTAPVWMGEFGNSERGHYWNNMMHYLNEYDIDFAYWAINGKKWKTGYIDVRSGIWIPEAAHWSQEPFGMLAEDYWTLRSVWRLLDLQALMPSPAHWRPLAPACNRQVLGSQCGD
eukprot:TRINITY_DN12176_c4_g1_i1.p1 TRINITY_DN12176_c4_g1~~TRINITY_DN12176_c4_g1_i1.p1  ORF type:complete len:737 (+),score=83.88 TRINITY_DN12176_c4_g1_i1:65-2275(+)